MRGEVGRGEGAQEAGDEECHLHDERQGDGELFFTVELGEKVTRRIKYLNGRSLEIVVNQVYVADQQGRDREKFLKEFGFENSTFVCRMKGWYNPGNRVTPMPLQPLYDSICSGNACYLEAYHKQAEKDALGGRAPYDARVIHKQNVTVQERKMEDEEGHEQHEVCREGGLELAVVLGESRVLIDEVIIVLRSETREAYELENHRTEFCARTNKKCFR